ncbi:MAG TPA: hypothetical protein VFK94_00020 [Patescibacteria group bacterium]|nr:hypothetical protein [Patescibacteria group bacterium]
MTLGKRIAALALFGIFSLTLGLASSAGPLLAQSQTATPAAQSKVPTPIRHFLGIVTVINVSGSSFTLDNGTKKFVVATSGETKFLGYTGGKKSASNFSSLQVGSKVSVVGQVAGSTLTAKIVALLPSKKTSRHGDSGKITAISGSSVTYTPVSKKNSSGTANFTSTTVFTKKVDGKITRVTASSLIVGDRISLVGTADDKGVITAKLIHIIPATPVTTKTATSSAN